MTILSAGFYLGLLVIAIKFKKLNASVFSLGWICSAVQVLLLFFQLWLQI